MIWAVFLTRRLFSKKISEQKVEVATLMNMGTLRVVETKEFHIYLGRSHFAAFGIVHTVLSFECCIYTSVFV